MRTKLLTVVLLAGGSLFAGNHWSIAVGIGTPYYQPLPPPPVVMYAPPCPGPQYTWIPGYYYPAGARFVWHAGYWSRPPYAGAYWVGPRYYENRYYPGYWKGRWERHDRGRHRGWYQHGDE
jgi:hypothetical protein